MLGTLVRNLGIVGPEVGPPDFPHYNSWCCSSRCLLDVPALMSRFLRKERVQQTIGDMDHNSRKYVVALRVSARSPVVGSSL